MDYEKAYKDALERANNIKRFSSNPLEIIRMEEIFPELKESEDERIRKDIIHYLSLVGKGDGDYDQPVIDKWIAWLEKQGEQKLAIFIPKFHVGDKLVSTNNPSLTYEVLEVGHINELGNQDYKVEIFTDSKVENPRNIQYIECYKVDEWAELIEQKPAWSEEDEKIIETMCKEGDLRPSQMIWLKSIKDRVQPQQKQEWSEEDEKYINDILAILGGGRGYRSNRQIEEWIKSLKPQSHWKPTNEQMEALGNAIESLKDNDYSVHELIILFNDLQFMRV